MCHSGIPCDTAPAHTGPPSGFPGDELKDYNPANGVQVEVTYRDGTTGTSMLNL